MKRSGDYFQLVSFGKPDEVNGITRNADGQLSIQFRVMVGIQQGFPVKHVQVLGSAVNFLTSARGLKIIIVRHF